MIPYLKDKFRTALNKSGLEPEDIIFERPNDDKFGDLSTNIAMVLAKQAKKNPKVLAKELTDNLGEDDIIDKCEIAGPGFINIMFKKDVLYFNMNKILMDGSEYGKLDSCKGQKANIEWVSANPTGPLHAGHGRHIALGKAISHLLEWAGLELTREYYFNNAGKQMDNLAASVYARYRQINQPAFPMPEDGYAGDYIKEIAQDLYTRNGDTLKENDPEFKRAGEEWGFSSIKNTLARMSINHNIFFNEDSLYKEGKIKNILEEFEKKGLSYKKDGAVWLSLKDRELHIPGTNTKAKFNDDKVIVKSTGEPTYRLPDIAYHIEKLNRGYDMVIDIFGADHLDTYKEVLAGLSMLGHDISKIKVILHQMVTFVQNGKPVKMSKRSDNVYYLDELLDDVGVDVAQFFFVMRSANTHLDFDVDLAREQSEKNPVFYLQYAHARICGILRNAEEAVQGSIYQHELLNNPEEVYLLRKLLFFPYMVESAYNSLEPHKIIIYLNELAEAFHKFYHNHRVINTEEPEQSVARLTLCRAVKQVLANGFSIIGISAPERM
jgi:arginyl-tRNA synthetase